VDGEVFYKKEVLYKIEGRWSDKITLINAKTGEKEIPWVKNPYPENWEYMYGMSRFGI
jgi:hypothetical protein